MSLSVRVIVAGRSATLRADTPVLVLTVESAAVRAKCQSTEWALDRSNCLVCPAKEAVRLRKDNASARVVLLGFTDELVDAVTSAYSRLNVTRERLAPWLSQPAVLPRTVWVHEIVHRYLFERYVLGEHDNATTAFLEVEILKELYFLFRDRADGADRASAARSFSVSVERAVEFIEAHLFEPVDVPALAAHAHTSQSTLLRAFHREFSCAPAAFWRARKLDEAMVLLRAGSANVSEIALEVGYENATAFGFAFRKRFGRPPNLFRPRANKRAAP
jgi:AraC-like DNA-binding protein